VKTVLISYFLLLSLSARTQTFPVIGQLPTTAFPVCGTSIFSQSTVPIGVTHALAVPGCGSYSDNNPFWYSFTCYTSGTLGFLITPNNPGDDYDWMLFDITGHNPNDVFTDVSLIVSGNWAGTYGLTGAKRGGSQTIECASVPSDNVSTFSNLVNLIQGHKYLLLVSHYTETQSGYTLAFGSGTAVITDPLLPVLETAYLSCDRKSLTVVLNKQMRCNSLAADGSDFILASNPVSLVGASGVNCNSEFDMDSVLINFSAPLTPGNYSLLAQIGTDGNTLVDNCGNQVEVGDSILFTVPPLQPTPLDSLITPGCAPEIIRLVFSKPIQCSSIAPDGSDFVISGNPAIKIASAAGSCLNGLTSTIDLTFNSPIVTGGNFTITLVTGSDGNTIIDACDMQTPANSTISFITKDTVSADFGYAITLNCKYDTINVMYNPENGVDLSLWNVDSSFYSNAMDPLIAFSIYGNKNIQHIVSNGFCSDTTTEIVNLNNTLQAKFLAPTEVCPKDLVNFSDISVGNIISWSWNFGDGSVSNQQTPLSHLFPNTQAGKSYNVSLIVENNLGCFDTLMKPITKLQSCYITVPNAFTPNADGKNDYLYPLNAFLATNLEFMVYNRFGQLIFETKDWSRKWDGTIGGVPQPSGTYAWTLQYTDGPSGKSFFLKGTSVLIR
jgi:gliding motility-associated-like protein